MLDLIIGAAMAQRLAGYRSDVVNATVFARLHPGVEFHPNADDLAKLIALCEADEDYKAFLKEQDVAAKDQAAAAEQAQVAEVTAAEQVRAELQAQIGALKAAHETHAGELAALRDSVRPASDESAA